MTDRHPALDELRQWRVTIPKGRMVYDESDTPKAFYRVESGCVSLLVHSEDGHRQILAFCLPGDTFGLDLAGARATAAEATTASVLTRFPLAVLTDGGLNARTMTGLVAAATDMNVSLSMHLRGLGHVLAEDRLMWFLDWLADRQSVSRHGGLVQPPMSRRDIADFLGLAQETLSRTFARLEVQGLLRVSDIRRLILRPRRPTNSDNPFRQAA